MRRALYLSFILVLALALVPLSAKAQDRNDEDSARFQFGGTVTVHEDEVLGFVLAVDANVIIDGDVSGTIILLGSDAVINGTIDGHVIAAGGSLRLSEDAFVTGDIAYTDTTYTAEPGAVIAGTVRDDLGTRFSQDFTRFLAWISLANWVGTTLLLLLGGIVFAGVGGRQLWASAAAVSGKPLQSILAAVALWAGGGILIVSLFVSVLGIPVALFLLMLLAGIWMLGYIVAGTRIGAVLTRRAMRSEVEHPYLPAVAGILALQLLALIPVLLSLVLAYSGINNSDSFRSIAIVSISGLISALIWPVGLLGTGAVTYRAFRAWTGGPAAAREINQPAPSER